MFTLITSICGFVLLYVASQLTPQFATVLFFATMIGVYVGMPLLRVFDDSDEESTDGKSKSVRVYINFLGGLLGGLILFYAGTQYIDPLSARVLGGDLTVWPLFAVAMVVVVVSIFTNVIRASDK